MPGAVSLIGANGELVPVGSEVLGNGEGGSSVPLTETGTGPTEPAPPVDRITAVLPATVISALPADETPVPTIAVPFSVLMGTIPDAAELAPVPTGGGGMTDAPPVKFKVAVTSKAENCAPPEDITTAAAELVGES